MDHHNLFGHLIKKFGEVEAIRDYYRDAVVYTIADQVLLARKELGLSRRELAKKAGLRMKEISKIENNDASLTLETLIKIADVLDLSLRGKLVPYSELNLDCS